MPLSQACQSEQGTHGPGSWVGMKNVSVREAIAQWFIADVTGF